MTKRVCVYCGSSSRVDAKYLDAGRAFGARAANAGLGIVYGGAASGVMGAVADGCLDAGGEVIGVLPDVLMGPVPAAGRLSNEHGHPRLTQLLRVPDMHTRKAVMSAYADAFVALPGGFGTLDELFEALTWRMIGTHAKPIALLDVDGYWSHLIAFVDHAARAGFVADAARGFFFVEPDADALLQRLFFAR